MTPEEFLLARIDDAENGMYKNATSIDHQSWELFKNLLDGMRKAIEVHQNWPVLVSKEPEMHFEMVEHDRIAYFATQQFEWATQKEYVARFGSQPPTSPMLRYWLLPYRLHPDFQSEWL